MTIEEREIQRQDERYLWERKNMVELLRLLNRQDKTYELIRNITGFIQKWTGCEAIGVRLKDGDDYPYFETKGFPSEFVLLENSLCTKNMYGQIERDEKGYPVLECMCGNVICGRFNPSLPFFTKKGSFWTNCTTELLASTTEKDRQARTRNRCNGEGYESVALFRLRTGNETLGLLQINDRRKGMFTEEILEFLESVSDQIAIALSQRQAQEALEKSEKLYSSLFKNMLNGFAYCKMIFEEGRPVDFIYLAVNDAFEQQTGLKNVTGKKVSEVIPNIREIDPELLGIYGRVAMTGKPEKFETYLKTLNMWFSVSVYSPEREYFVAVFDVITERKMAEEKIRSHIERLSLAMDAAKAGTWEWNVHTGENIWSEELWKVYGIEPYSCRPSYEAWRNIVHPLDREHAEKTVIEAREKGKELNFEFRVFDRDGTERTLMSRGKPVFDTEGQIGRYTGIVLDITERKIIEKEREMLVSAIEQSGEIVVITDSMGYIQYVNPAFEKITGYTRTDVTGQHIDILKSGKHDEEFYRNMWDTIKGGNNWKGQFINRKKDGTFYTEETTISPVRNSSETITNYIAVKRDITENLQLQEEKEKLQSQFMQAQKMEAVGRLAGGVAHDFNNILGIILSSAELALDKIEESHPACTNLMTINNVTYRAAALTRQLLAFARKQTISPRIIDLNETVESMLKMLRRIIGEDIDLAWIPEAHLWPVKIDPSQIDQLLANLCINARDAISGVGKITIETENVLFDEEYCKIHMDINPGEYIMLCVSDTGCGMEQDILEHIFEPFFTTKGTGKGTGLGLATVYGIVKQNRGMINIYSEPQKGTVFKIYLPVCKEEIEAKKEKILSKPQGGMGETLLIVEDDTTLLELCTKILSGLGYNVLSYGNTGEAIKMAEEYKGKIDLLITDVVMPDMTGKDMADRLLLSHKNMKCLYMSGYTANVIAHHGILAEGIHFIEKPFSTKMLASKIRQIIEIT